MSGLFRNYNDFAVEYKQGREGAVSRGVRNDSFSGFVSTEFHERK